MARGRARDFRSRRGPSRDTYRAVYTVRFEGAVYVLHAFQKKSPSDIRTSKRDVALIARRLREARMDFEVRYAERRED
jgi:phage-related protein